MRSVITGSSDSRSEGGRCDSVVEKPVRSVVTGSSDCRSEGGQGTVRGVVQAVDTSMMAGRGGRVERATGGKTKHSGSASDWKVKVEGSSVERVRIKRNNRIEIT
jgi:hypothetical protein